MGKYAALKDALEPLPQDQTWQQKIDVVKGKYAGAHLGNLGETFNKVRAEKEKKEEELGKINTELEALTQLILSGMEDNGISLVKLEDGSTLYVQDKPYCRVANRQAFLDWVKETGRESLLTVQYQTMNSLVSELLLDGQEPPPGIKAWMKTSLGRRKG